MGRGQMLARPKGRPASWRGGGRHRPHHAESEGPRPRRHPSKRLQAPRRGVMRARWRLRGGSSLARKRRRSRGPGFDLVGAFFFCFVLVSLCRSFFLWQFWEEGDKVAPACHVEIWLKAGKLILPPPARAAAEAAAIALRTACSGLANL